MSKDVVKGKGAAVDAPVEQKKKPGRQPSDGPTVASVAMAAIKAGKDNKQVLALVKEQFPESKTGMASINWYRNKAREEDPSIPTSRSIGAEVRVKAKAEKAAAKLAEKEEKAKVKAAEKAKAAADKKAAAEAAKKAAGDKGSVVDPTA